MSLNELGSFDNFGGNYNETKFEFDEVYFGGERQNMELLENMQRDSITIFKNALKKMSEQELRIKVLISKELREFE